MARQIIAPKVMIAWLFLPAGCVTIARFKQTEKRVARLQQDVAWLKQERESLDEKIERLHQRLKQTEQSLKKGGANLGAEVEGLRVEVARLKGENEEIKYALSRAQEEVTLVKQVLDKKLGVPAVRLPESLPKSPKGLLGVARKYAASGDMNTARAVLLHLLERYPDHELAPGAQFLLGQLYFQAGDCRKAIGEYQRVHDRYGRKGKEFVGKALLGIARCLAREKECKKAKQVLQYLLRTEGKSSAASEAKGLLKRWKPRRCEP